MTIVNTLHVVSFKLVAQGTRYKHKNYTSYLGEQTPETHILKEKDTFQIFYKIIQN